MSDPTPTRRAAVRRSGERGSDDGTVSATGPRTRAPPSSTVAVAARSSDDGTPRVLHERGRRRAALGRGVLAGAAGRAALVAGPGAARAIAAYVATSRTRPNGGAGWFRSVGVGSSIWLLGHGGRRRTSAPVMVTLVPLGVTLLALFVCCASARRSGWPTWSAVRRRASARTRWSPSCSRCSPGSPAVDLARRSPGAPLVAAIGLRRRDARASRGADLRALTRPVWIPLPAPSGPAPPAGCSRLPPCVLVAAVVTALWVLAGRATIGDIVRGLGLDAVGGVVLAVAELAYLPNLVVWALAWLAGRGLRRRRGDAVRARRRRRRGAARRADARRAARPRRRGGRRRPGPARPRRRSARSSGCCVHRRLAPQRWWDTALASARLRCRRRRRRAPGRARERRDRPGPAGGGRRAGRCRRAAGRCRGARGCAARGAARATRCCAREIARRRRAAMVRREPS